MTSRVKTCNSLTPFMKFYIGGFLFVTLILANALPAAAVTVQPSALNALAKPVGAVKADSLPDLLLVRRGDGDGRRSGRGRGDRKSDRGDRGDRREYGDRGRDRREHRGNRGRHDSENYDDDRRGHRGGGRGRHDSENYDDDRREYRGGRDKDRRAKRSKKRRYGGSRSRNYYYYGLPFYGYAPYDYYYGYRPGYDRCAYWSRRCAANWGYGNRDYYGCMRYYGCR